MTAESTQAPSIKESDEVLLAELTPQMLAKLKMDSRVQGSQTGVLLVLTGTGSAPAFAKQFDGYLALLIVALALRSASSGR